jgi:hypothetical protein
MTAFAWTSMDRRLRRTGRRGPRCPHDRGARPPELRDQQRRHRAAERDRGRNRERVRRAHRNRPEGPVLLPQARRGRRPAGRSRCSRDASPRRGSTCMGRRGIHRDERGEREHQSLRVGISDASREFSPRRRPPGSGRAFLRRCGRRAPPARKPLHRPWPRPCGSRSRPVLRWNHGARRLRELGLAPATRGATGAVAAQRRPLFLILPPARPQKPRGAVAIAT